MKGKLIVIEGLDGSGKATQSEILTNYIKLNRQAIKISFPDYSSPSSTLVKMYLKGEIGELDAVNVYAASSFYSLDRYISYQTIWGKTYNEGCHIVADRYTTSNLSHQMVKLPKDKWEEYISWLNHYEYNLLGLPKPDLVIYLDMHPITSKALLEKRYNGDESQKDIHEENFAYLLSCREAALFSAHKLGWEIVSCSDEGYNPISVDNIAKTIKDIYNRMID